MIGPYVKVNPNERPTEYWARVRGADSDGGIEVTRTEAKEGNLLLSAWEREKFVRLTTLPTKELSSEIRALREMQKLPKENFDFPFVMMGSWVTNIALTGIVFGLLAISLGLDSISNHLEDIRKDLKIIDQAQLVDTLDIKLKELDARLARGEIKKEDYEAERRKIIEAVVKAK